MKSVAIIGFSGKGLFNTPTKIDNVKDLHINFGKKSNLVSVAEQIIYGENSPFIVRLADDSNTASAYLLDSDDTICMTVHADSPGSSGDLTTIEIVRNDDSFNMLVFNSGEMVEFWGDLKPEQAEEIINFTSKWITVSTMKQKWPVAGTIKLRLENTKNKRVDLDGILNAVKSLDNLDIEFISMPDCDSPEIINTVLQYLEDERSDAVLVIDPPWEYDIFQTYKWCKKLMPSDYGVVFWSWLDCERKSIPSSGPTIAALFNWPFPWKFVRTKLAGVSNITLNIHQDELSYLSKQEHFINLLKNKNHSVFIDAPILTLAGGKLSERRLLNHINTKISKIGLELLSVHNPVSHNFRKNFIESSEYILNQIREDQGINNYNIKVNELANPDEFGVSIEIAIKDSVEIVNIFYKFAK